MLLTSVGGKRKKGKFPLSGAIEVSPPGSGAELDADISINKPDREWLNGYALPSWKLIYNLALPFIDVHIKFFLGLN